MFNPESLDPEKLDELAARAEYFKNKFNIPLAFAFLLSINMDIHDKLCELKCSVDDMCYGPEDDNTPIEEDEWKDASKKRK